MAQATGAEQLLERGDLSVTRVYKLGKHLRAQWRVAPGPVDATPMPTERESANDVDTEQAPGTRCQDRQMNESEDRHRQWQLWDKLTARGTAPDEVIMDGQLWRLMRPGEEPNLRTVTVYLVPVDSEDP